MTISQPLQSSVALDADNNDDILDDDLMTLIK